MKIGRFYSTMDTGVQNPSSCIEMPRRALTLHEYLDDPSKYLPVPLCRKMDILMPGRLLMSTIVDSGTHYNYIDFKTFAQRILPSAHMARAGNELRYLNVMDPTGSRISTSPTADFLRKPYRVVHYVSIPCRIDPDRIDRSRVGSNTKRIKFHILNVGSDTFNPVIGGMGIRDIYFTL